ncbi:hypothetical protein APHAL10511_005073 [Amanita phalloides]|nr:hypothetical protein APHAL10511_005073 [Amanita phalloides]
MSNKRSSIFSLKFRKSKGDVLSRTVSEASTLIGTVNEKKGKASKYAVCEEDLLDWEDQAWGAPKTNITWSGLFQKD